MSDELDKLIREYNELADRYDRVEKEYNQLTYYDGNPRKAMYRMFRDEKMLCPGCQRVFVREHGNQTYCSQSCRQRAYRIRQEKQKEVHWKRCVVCDAGFVAQHPSKKTCSERCRKDRKNFLARAQRKHTNRVYGRVCAVCGKSFVSAVSHAKYCGDACRRVASNARHRKRYAEKKVKERGILMSNEKRVSYDVAVERLHQFEQLSDVIVDAWLQEQMKNDVKDYGLITGWLTTSPERWRLHYFDYTRVLENGLKLLKDDISESSWDNICGKLTRSGRHNTKGTLSEISVAVFLAERKLAFDMERQLKPPPHSNDVDFSVKLENQQEIHIEVQFVSESDRDKEWNKVSAANHGMSYKPDFEGEKQRIIDRVYKKLKKLTTGDITLVALDYSDVGLSFMPEALEHIFESTTTDIPSGHMQIRELVDGVMWFEVDYGNALQPIQRGIFLNQHSPHKDSASLAKWAELWSNSQ